MPTLLSGVPFEFKARTVILRALFGEILLLLPSITMSCVTCAVTGSSEVTEEDASEVRSSAFKHEVNVVESKNNKNINALFCVFLSRTIFLRVLNILIIL